MSWIDHEFDASWPAASWQAGYEEWKKKLLEGLPEAIPPPLPPDRFCLVHSPVEYEGLTDRFMYCSVCDAKLRGDLWVK